MKNLIKYELKSNLKFFLSTGLVFIIFIIAIGTMKTMTNSIENFSSKDTLNVLIVLEIITFIFTIVMFFVNTFYRDLYTTKSTLTFTLPIKSFTYIFSKIIVTDIFFIALVLLFFVSSVFMKFYLITVKNIILALFYMLILNFIILVTFSFMQMNRYKLSKYKKIFPSIAFFITLVIISFFICYNFVFTVYGSREKFFLANFYPFENLKSNNINFIPFLIYIMLFLVYFFMNKKILENNLDLS
ncbi:MAG: hypothetical protein SOZ89_04695 [Peptoniphilaceae bacterium]|nr:hypothetical protein [Peptoniphilaceae bacterium]MDY3738404.1 hypothetical protein [Peptoniphilaceae bacterium]